MTTYTENPFTMVYDALWDMMERNTTLTGLIRKANRIKYAQANATKPAISDGDLPEIALLSSGGDSNVMNTSSTSSMVRRYTWAIATGEYQINPFYNTVSWELYRAMIDWDQVLCALVWPAGGTWHFVVRTNVISIEKVL